MRKEIIDRLRRLENHAERCCSASQEAAWDRITAAMNSMCPDDARASQHGQRFWYAMPALADRINQNALTDHDRALFTAIPLEALEIMDVTPETVVLAYAKIFALCDGDFV